LNPLTDTVSVREESLSVLQGEDDWQPKLPVNRWGGGLKQLWEPVFLKVLVGAVGVEPTTNGLKGRCSATELRP
jgi:hypothetical protein